MLRLVYKVLLADVILFAALLLVLQDISWRGYYAATPHASAAAGYTTSYSFSILTRYFTMTGGNFPLVSPPTLDWVQVIVLFIVVINGWLVYQSYLALRPPLPA